MTREEAIILLQSRVDLISRQAAIDAICEDGVQLERHAQYSMTMVERKQRDVDILEALPPVSFENHDEIKSYSKDTISRQQAIDVIDAVFPVDPMKSEYAQGIACGAALAKTYVEQLPAAQPQTSMLTVECKLDDEELEKAIEEVKKANLELIAAEPHWIPCSEQLPPEENKTYWVCTDNGHQHECRWTNANPIWTHLTTDWHWNIFDIPQYTKVVAWMELPKPYDGGEQDG